MGLGDIVYKPGYSFRNTPLVRPVTKIRRDPWFYERMTGGPQTKSAKIRRWRGGNLNRYKAVWHRGMRQAVADKLGHALNEMPSYDEYQLGQAPGPTDTVKTSTRDPLGFLSNILTQGAETAGKIVGSIQKQEEERIKEAQAQIQFYTQQAAKRAEAAARTAGQVAVQNWPILVGVGILGVAAMFAMQQQRKKS